MKNKLFRIFYIVFCCISVLLLITAILSFFDVFKSLIPLKIVTFILAGYAVFILIYMAIDIIKEMKKETKEIENDKYDSNDSK